MELLENILKEINESLRYKDMIISIKEEEIKKLKAELEMLKGE